MLKIIFVYSVLVSNIVAAGPLYEYVQRHKKNINSDISEANALKKLEDAQINFEQGIIRTRAAIEKGERAVSDLNQE